MKKTVKIIAAVAAGLMALQATAFAAFTDMPEGEIGVAMQAAVDNGLISGYEDGTVRPNDYITRAQMATIIVRAMGATANSTQTFPDVAADAWYADAVSKSVAMSAFKGDTDGKFNPENNITFQETYTVLSRVFCFEGYPRHTTKGTSYISKSDPAVLDAFADKSSVADWAVDYAAAVVEKGGYQGMGGLLKGDAMITRGEFAYLMSALIGTYIDEPGTYTAADLDATKSIVVRKGGVVIDGLTTSRNLIVAYSVDTSGVQLKNVDISGVTAIMGGADPVNNTSCVSIQGKFNDVRVNAPGITLDASAVEKMNYYKGDTGSILYMGILG